MNIANPAPMQSEAAQPENAGRNPDGTFAKGSSANPAGKPKGARHKAFFVHPTSGVREGFNGVVCSHIRSLARAVAVKKTAGKRDEGAP